MGCHAGAIVPLWRSEDSWQELISPPPCGFWGPNSNRLSSAFTLSWRYASLSAGLTLNMPPMWMPAIVLELP